MKKNNIYQLTIAGICLALTQILPLFTGQIPEIGRMLAPMHLPVLICGMLCSPIYAMIVGIIAPLMRFVLFGMPILFPVGIAMSFELATYGVVSALLYKRFKGKAFGIYISLISAMLVGRIVWGAVMVIISGVSAVQFSWNMFIAAAFINAIPGIIVQLILVPLIITVINRVGGRNVKAIL